MSDESALEAIDVTKVYGDGTRALDGATLDVARRRTTALLGESGCGKSTLLRLFNGMVAEDSGDVRVAGRRIAGRDWIAARRTLGYVPQNGGLLPHWSVERNIGLVPELLGWSVDQRTRRTREILELVGLDAGAYRRRFPKELSGGQRQRVALARALAADPDILLLDEPFGALDAITRLELQAEFRDLQKRLDKSVLLVTHDLDEAFRLADSIAVMRRGRILQAGAPEEVLSTPADPYVAQLIALGRQTRGRREHGDRGHEDREHGDRV